MSTIQRLKPSGVVSTDDVTTIGAADVALALRRNSTSDFNRGSYVQYNVVSGSAECIVDVDDIPALTINQRIARLRIKAGAFSANGNVRFHGYIRQSTTDAESFYKNIDLNDAGTNIVGSWINAQPVGGAEWTEAAVNAVRMRLYDSNAGTAQPRAYYAEIEADVHTRPSVVITTPASGGLEPLYDQWKVGWNFEADGDSQNRYQVKVFTEAQVTGGTFNPDTDLTVYDSGIISGGSPSHFVPVGVLGYNQRLYVYVKASSLFPGPTAGEEWWSPWSSRLFKSVSRPNVDITYPIGAIANAQPTILYAYTDADGKVPVAIWFYIFKQPAGGWTGFDPQAALQPGHVDQPIYTGVVTGKGDGTHPMTYPALQNGTTYRTYSQTFIEVPFGDVTAFDNEDFTTSWTAPATPGLTTAVELGAQSRIKLSVKNNNNHASTRITVERSIDGVTWVKVRGLDTVNIPYNTTVDFYDYEMPLRVPVTYRAWAVSTSSGAPTQSALATSVQTFKPKLNYLKDVTDPSRNLHVITVDRWVDRSHARDRSFFKAIGRDKPIPMRGVSKFETFSVQLVARTESEEDALKLLLDSDRVLLFQTARKSTFVELSGDYSESEYLWADLHSDPVVARLFTVSFTEVDDPS